MKKRRILKSVAKKKKVEEYKQKLKNLRDEHKTDILSYQIEKSRLQKEYGIGQYKVRRLQNDPA